MHQNANKCLPLHWHFSKALPCLLLLFLFQLEIDGSVPCVPGHNFEHASLGSTFVDFEIAFPAVDGCFDQVPELDQVAPPYRSMTDLLSFIISASPVDPAQYSVSWINSDPYIDVNELRFVRSYSIVHQSGATKAAVHHFSFGYYPESLKLQGVPDDLLLKCGDPVPDWPMVRVEGWNYPVETIEQRRSNSCGGIYYLRTWIAKNPCGKSWSATQKISFEDDYPPFLSIPGDTVIDIGAQVPDPVYEAGDGGCSSFRVELDEQKIVRSACEFDLIRTWTAIDGCHNKTVKTQTISIVDKKAPQIKPVNPVLRHLQHGGEIISYDCNNPRVGMQDVEVSDDCETDLNISTSDALVVDNGCDLYGYYRKWKCSVVAQDAAGNSGVFEFYILQYDTTRPKLENVPLSFDLECGAPLPPIPTNVVASDNCHLDAIPSFSQAENTDSVTGDLKEIVRTWTFEDACGNKNEKKQVITICNFVNADLREDKNQGVEFFRVTSRGCTNFLQWKVEDHSAIDHFKLSKSEGGQDFEPFGIITEKHLNYTIRDIVAFKDTHYKLEVFNQKGENTYSDILMASNSSCIKSKLIFSVFPNPADSKIRLKLDNKQDTRGMLMIRNVMGESISKSEIDLEKGKQYKDIDCSPFSPGLYIISVETKNEINSKTFIKNQ